MRFRGGRQIQYIIAVGLLYRFSADDLDNFGTGHTSIKPKGTSTGSGRRRIRVSSRLCNRPWR